MSTTINLTTSPQSVPLLTGNQLMIVEHTGGNMVYYRSTSNVGPGTNDGVLTLGQTTQFYSGPVWFASDSTAQIIVTYVSSPITPTSVATVSANSATKLPKFYVLPASGDTSGASDAAAITATAAALRLFANGGGILQFQEGHYYDNTARDYHATAGLIWQGAGGASSGSAPGTEVTYTGTAARYLDARSSNGFQVRDIMLFASNASFTGNLIDLSHDGAGNADAANWSIANNYLGMTATSAGAVIYLDDAIVGHICHNTISGGAFGVQGVAVNAHYSNGIVVNGQNVFVQQGTAAISGPGQGWSISGNTFELQNGNAAIAQAFASQSGGEIAGNWFGDTVGSQTIITVGTGVSVRGNFIAGSGTTTGISVPAGVAAVDIRGNVITAHSVGISLASSASDVVFFPNFFSSNSTNYTVPTAAVGAAAGTGGSVGASVGVSSDAGGAIIVTTGSAGVGAGALCTVTLASTHSQMRVVLQPFGSNTGPLGAYISGITSTSFTISVTVAPAINTVYEWFWMLVPTQ